MSRFNVRTLNVRMTAIAESAELSAINRGHSVRASSFKLSSKDFVGGRHSAAFEIHSALLSLYEAQKRRGGDPAFPQQMTLAEMRRNDPSPSEWAEMMKNMKALHEYTKLHGPVQF